MRYSCKDIGAVCRGTFDAVSMIDSTFACFVVDIEVLKVVVEVDASRAKVSAEQCGVSCEDGGNVDVTFSKKRNSETCLPFMEMGYDSSFELTSDILNTTGTAMLACEEVVK